MKRIFYISLIGLSASCGIKPTEISPNPQQESKVTEQEDFAKPIGVYPSSDIAEGSSLFNNNCGKCHALPEIPKYSKEKWQKIVPSMAKESKLDNIQESKVMAFVNWKITQQ